MKWETASNCRSKIRELDAKNERLPNDTKALVQSLYEYDVAKKKLDTEVEEKEMSITAALMGFIV